MTWAVMWDTFPPPLPGPQVCKGLGEKREKERYRGERETKRESKRERKRKIEVLKKKQCALFL